MVAGTLGIIRLFKITFVNLRKVNSAYVPYKSELGQINYS